MKIIWCMVPETGSARGKIFFILGHFLPFYSTNNLKNQNFGKMKKTSGHIMILHKCTKNHDHMLCCSWDIARDGCDFCFSFWAIFCPFTPLTAQKIKTKKKMEKTPGDVTLQHLYQKLWSHDVQFPRYGARRMNRWTDGWTDGRTEKMTYRSGCPN